MADRAPAGSHRLVGRPAARLEARRRVDSRGVRRIGLRGHWLFTRSRGSASTRGYLGPAGALPPMDVLTSADSRDGQLPIGGAAGLGARGAERDCLVARRLGSARGRRGSRRAGTATPPGTSGYVRITALVDAPLADRVDREELAVGEVGAEAEAEDRQAPSWRSGWSRSRARAARPGSHVADRPISATGTPASFE